MKKSSTSKTAAATKCLTVRLEIPTLARLVRAAKENKRSKSSQAAFFIARCVATPEEREKEATKNFA